MKKLLFALLAAVCLMATSCSTYYRSMKEPNVLVKLTPADYTLSEPVTAEVSVTYIFGIDFEHLFNDKSAHTGILGSVLNTHAQSIAIYEVLEANPGYDFVMYPQFKSESHGIPLFEKETVTVTCRLGKFNQ